MNLNWKMHHVFEQIPLLLEIFVCISTDIEQIHKIVDFHMYLRKEGNVKYW